MKKLSLGNIQPELGGNELLFDMADFQIKETPFTELNGCGN